MRRHLLSSLTLSLLFVAGCSGDDSDLGETAPGGSQGGSAGAAGQASGGAGKAGSSQAGQAGQGGASGSSGQAGQAGQPGQGGASGQAGGGGSSGSSGQAGQPGGGQAGQAGQAGQGGQAGQAGQAGQGGGAAGASGASGQAGSSGASGQGGAAGAVGAFRRTAVHQGYGEAWGLASADVDGDGEDELVLAGRNVVAMKDAGLEKNAPLWAHDWAPEGPATSNGDNDWAYAVAAHDVDGDGRADVTALSSQRRLVSLRGTDGATLFDEPLAFAGQAVSMVTFDGDDDGVPDLFVTGEAAAYSGKTGKPLFQVPQPHLHVFSARAELDGDDRHELLLGLEHNSIVGPGGGGPKGPPETLYAVDHQGNTLWKADVGGNVASLDRADLDGDGKDEIAVVAPGKVVVLRPDGTTLATLAFPEAEPPTKVALAVASGKPVVAAAVIDPLTLKAAVVGRSLDGAESFRVEVPAAEGPVTLLKVVVPAGSTVPLLIAGTGQSSPAGGQVMAVDLTPGAKSPLRWAAETGLDVDAVSLTHLEGKEVLSVGGRSTVVSLLDPASGQPAAEWLPGSFLAATAVGDLDGDGVDEAASVDDHAVLRVTRASGEQLFARKLSVGALGVGTSVQIADLDGDGTPEVLAGAQPLLPSELPGVIDVLDAKGALLRTIVTGGRPDAVRVADLDGDGAPEIVAGEASSADATSGPCGVRAYSPSGQVLFTAPIGSCFSALIETGDLDGEKGAEIAYGDTVIIGDPHVALVGGDGAVRWSLVVPELTGFIGIDGQKRLVFGSAATDNRGKLTQRAASDGAPVWEAFFDGYTEKDGIDRPGTVASAAFVPDQDGDGLDEIATVHASGEVRLCAGKDGAVLWTRELEEKGLDGSDRHTARAVAFVPAWGGAPAYLVAGQGGDYRMRARTFALTLAGELDGSVDTTGEARAGALPVRTPEGPRALVPTGLDMSFFGR